MEYLGEHLLPGQIGRFLVALSLVSSLFATIAYYKSAVTVAIEDQLSWKKLARIAFVIDTVSVISVFLIILYIISNHYFEYHYAWNHSDKSLNRGYLIASIWEGQEGSFLLWAMWHGVLGLLLIRTARKWEAPVMTVVSFAQVCVATMILGLYIFDVKIGSNPFLLTREVFPDAPVFKMPDYLSNAAMQDGNGLNQTLQNYWMVIHPPVLFLGFASTLIPFAFAVAGLWRRDYGGWIKISLPWVLFSSAILGLGIMMGARWAYESLSFGGYWAWDPVENASLVPWLVLIAGLHTHLIYNATGRALRPTMFFYIATFALILYSTYLTRSGDLQDTSVHAFTGSGLNWQLRAFVMAFALPALILFVVRYKHIPSVNEEEHNYSREFWMFIGSLVLFISAAFITLFTSLPVINKIFGTNFTVGADVEFFYNRIQVFVAIVLGILTAVTQYLRYRITARKYFGKKILLPTAISLVIAGLISTYGNIDYDQYGIGYLAAIHIALFAGIYAAVANAGYILAGLSGKLKAAGASVGHVGFGLMLVGILISSSKKEVLSINRLNPLNFGPDSENKGVENLTLFKGVDTDMGKYWATYAADSVDQHGKKTFFQIDMKKKDGKASFTLKPNVIKNTKGQEGQSANPDAKHYWNKDIFSYVTYAEIMNEGQDTARFTKHVMKVGDTAFYSAGMIILDKVVANPSSGKYSYTSKDTAIMAELSVFSSNGGKYKAYPVFEYKNSMPRYRLDTVVQQSLAVQLSNIEDKEHIAISVKESTKLTPFIALKILQFPFINLIWLGTILMMVGFVMSIVRRVKLAKV